MDDIFRKLVRPVDSRGLRGVFSRGNATYRPGTPVLNKVTKKPSKVIDYRAAIRKRYANGNRNR